VNVYSLLDRKLRVYGQLFLERNDYGVQRGLVDGIRSQGESLLARHPEDFDLFQVGVFDEESGLLGRSEAGVPRLVCNVGELMPVQAVAHGDQLSLLKEG